jgi:hypothetical protein
VRQTTTRSVLVRVNVANIVAVERKLRQDVATDRWAAPTEIRAPGPELRLWAAIVERGQEAQTARPDEEYLADEEA